MKSPFISRKKSEEQIKSIQIANRRSINRIYNDHQHELSVAKKQVKAIIDKATGVGISRSIEDPRTFRT
jgi:hypothetical protein